MKRFILLFILACTWFVPNMASAGDYLKILKNNSVVGYKEPTSQSKIITVFGQGDELEIAADSGGWYKVKITYSQGYFLYGWVMKSSPNIQRISKKETTATSTVLSKDEKDDNEDEEEDAEEDKKSRRSTGLDSSVVSDLNRNYDSSTRIFKFFGGAVFDLYRYGAFQYRFGLSYEVPVGQVVKIGFPFSYVTGDIFSIAQVGIEGMYGFYPGSIAIVPRLGIGYEYFFGNGESFSAGSSDIGISVEMAVADWLTVGIEPFAVRAMVWNSTSSINKIPWNLRGESMIILRGYW